MVEDSEEQVGSVRHWWPWILLAFVVMLIADEAGAITIDLCGGWQPDGSFHQCTTGDQTQIGATAKGVKVCESAGGCAQVALDPNAPGITPSGWSGPSSPPSTAQGQTIYQVVNQGGGCSSSNNWCASSSFAGACSGFVSGCSNLGFPCQLVNSSGECRYRYCSSSSSPFTTCNAYSEATASVSSSTQCPAGYSGNPCTLSNANLVNKPADEVSEWDRSGNTFAAEQKETEITDVGGLTIVNNGDNIIITGSGGESAKLTLNSGDSTANVRYSYPASGGNTSFMEWQVSSPGDGTGVIGKASGTNYGSGSLGTNDPVPSSGTCGGPGQPACNVAIDEQGATTQAGRDSALSAGQVYSNALDTQIGNMNSAAASGNAGQAGIAGLSQFVAPSGPDEDNGLLEVLPNGGDCVPASMSYMGQGITLDYCDIADFCRPVINWMLAALTGMYIWARFYRRGEV